MAVVSLQHSLPIDTLLRSDLFDDKMWSVFVFVCVEGGGVLCECATACVCV